MGLERSPVTKADVPAGGSLSKDNPPAPEMGTLYSKKEIDTMTRAQRQWLNARQNLVDWTTFNLIDDNSVGSSSTDASSDESLTVAFQQMLVDKRDSTTAPGTAPAPAPVPIWQTVVRADSEFLALHQETNIEKILWGWPDKNNP